MNPKHPTTPLKLIPWYLLILMFTAFLFSPIACKWLKPHRTEPGPNKGETISWNILFKPGTDEATRLLFITKVEAYIDDFYTQYNTLNGTNLTPTEKVVFCPCDTLLYNYNFSSIFGAGPSVTTAPVKQTGGSGDPVEAMISENVSIAEPMQEVSYTQYRNDKDSVVVVKNIPIDPAKKLAIIDSGIDPALFSPSVSKLIWQDAAPASTIYNFLPGQPLNDVADQTIGRHGSAVTAIIIKAMENVPKYPKLMILKGLDNENKGSIFSISCALSYAIQKQATIVNLSLGYLGAPDSVLHHYLKLCAVAPIHVFAAGGNLPAPHNPLDLCKLNLVSNLLNSPNLFYPACFSQSLSNIISVTQIRKNDSPCNYQNYSNQFINLGVYDPGNCCAIKVDYLPNNLKYYEGSSFATPVASGLMMKSIITSGNPNANNPDWLSLVKVDPAARVTIGGKYIEYASIR